MASISGNPQQAQVRQPEGYRCARAMRAASCQETLGRGVQVRGDGARQGLVAGVQSEVIREAGFGVARRGGQAGGLSKRP